MTDLHYPDNLYADALDKIRAVTQKPTGAYRSTDPVTKPAHYQRAGIETIDYIRATLSAPGFEAYCIGNVLKYVSRYREKGGVEDLRKAQVYLGWAINPKTDAFNPAAMREAKIAYDVASDKPAGFYSGPVRFSTLEGKESFERECVGILADSIATIREHVPKWDVRWAQTPPNCGLHPMNAETIRDHDERLSGAEDRL